MSKCTNIIVSIEIPASSAAIWTELEAIERHVEWMADAVAIDFHGEQRRGPGTSFSCLTKIGPFHTSDEMTIDFWDEGRAIGVIHRGAVTGSGRFVLTPISATASTLTWTETLQLPWWLGGSLGGFCARPIFHWIWMRNLARLALLVDGA